MQLMSFVLIERDDSYLLIKEASAKWGGEWFFPGGKVNRNETVGEAAVREVQEEAGCRVNVHGIFHVRYFSEVVNECLHVYFHGYTNDTCTKSFADENSLDARWFSYHELKGLHLRQNALEVVNAYRRIRSSLREAAGLIHL